MPDASASSTRLKRLSLLSRPPVPNADVSLDGEAPVSAASTESTPGTPQRSKTGLRTSILYSPAASEAGFSPRSTSTRHGKQTVLQSGPVEDDTARQRFKSETGNSSQRRMARTTETLVEKHADLLTLIAQKERRVHELKEELEQQEASLEQLKKRWTQLVIRQPPASQVTRIRPASTFAPSANHPLTYRRQTNMSVSAPDSSGSCSTSSPRPDSERSEDETANPPAQPSTSLDQSIANLLSNIPGESVGMEAVESGKRFWATLVKTVSAAAGGTVPESEAVDDSTPYHQAPPHSQWPSPSSSIFNSPTSPSIPAQPINYARLPRVQPVKTAFEPDPTGAQVGRRTSPTG